MAAADAEAEDTADETDESETMPAEGMTVVVRAEVLQQVVDQLLTIVDEAIFRIGHDGLDVRAVDPANVAMVDLDVEPGAFESVGDGSFPIGVNLQKLDSYIDGASGGDLITLSVDAEVRKVNIDHTNVEVEMAGIDPEAMRGGANLPDDIDHRAEFEVDAKVLADAVENADLVSDHVELKADIDEEALVVTGRGDIDEIETVVGEDELSEANFPEEVTSLFSLPYLVGGSQGGSKYGGLLKPLSSGTKVTGKLDDEMPVFLDYEFADGYGSVEMMLAPRIESN